MKEYQKDKTGVIWGDNKVTQDHKQCRVRIELYDFLFTFHRNYMKIVPFSRYSQLFAKNRNFFDPLLRVTPLEFHRDLWLQKTRFPWLSWGIFGKPFW